MKQFIYLMLVVFSLLSILNALTPSDYYIPLQVGNRLTYRSGNEESAWAPRTVYETIEGTDSLFGKVFYRQVGSEFMDDSPTEEHIFHVFWLREDSLGNILIGAVGMGDSRELDSAMIYPYQYPFFHAGYLELGYCQDTTYMGIRYHDSTLSVSETVETGIGTFYNCIQRRQFREDSLGNMVWHEYEWYAQDVGMVKLERVTPDAHINSLTHINFQTDIENDMTMNFFLDQNYPNPFNAETVIRLQCPASNNAVVDIYDAQGKQVDRLVNGFLEAGNHELMWDARDMPSGIYFYTLQVNNITVMAKKMLLIK